MALIGVHVTTQWNPEQIKEALRYAMARTVSDTSQKVLGDIQEKLSKKDNSSRMTPAKSGSPPAMVTGALRNSWNVDLTLVNGDNPKAFIQSNLKYAKILEYGSAVLGRLKPKKKQFLTIPLNEEASRLRARTKDLRTVDGLFVLKEKGERTKKGKRKKGKKGKDYLILAMSVGHGKTAKVKPMFLLVKSVYINKHPYIRPVVKKMSSSRALKKFDKSVGKFFIEYLRVST